MTQCDPLPPYQLADRSVSGELRLAGDTSSRLLEMLQDAERNGRKLHFHVHTTARDGAPRFTLYIDERPKKRVFLEAALSTNARVSS